jgi:alpha-tubulin suppressor-like RCC1 family protein
VRVLGNQRYTQITVGGYHSCARTVDGDVWCWGDNAWNQIDDAVTDAVPPRRIPLPEPVDAVEAGCSRTCARRGDRVWCWGSDDELVGVSRPVYEVSIPCPGR